MIAEAGKAMVTCDEVANECAARVNVGTANATVENGNVDVAVLPPVCALRLLLPAAAD